ncbi:MAG: nucleotidyltransferase domain-containing protein [Bifidobacterium sp.]|nr:nucleotidyltransferase domain-containing protein [Bifidobacterium sp.]
MQQAVPSVAQIADVARPIAQEHGVAELYLFGSAARGEATSDSDIDFIYDFPDDDMRVRELTALRVALSEAFGRGVDLVRKDYLESPKRERYAELMRRAFLHEVESHPIYKVV